LANKRDLTAFKTSQEQNPSKAKEKRLALVYEPLMAQNIADLKETTTTLPNRF